MPKLSRRQFFRRTAGAVAAAAAAPYLPAAVRGLMGVEGYEVFYRGVSPAYYGVSSRSETLTFKGLRMISSQYVLGNRVYFLNPTNYRLMALPFDNIAHETTS
jgi:hypothetical protein